jgi:predicted nucleic acid-binding protein
MSRFVLDNSVAMRWFIPCNKEQDQAYSREVLNSFSSSSALVPNLWHLEVVSAFLGSERRGENTEGQIESYLIKLDKLPIFVDPLTVHNAFSRTLALARAFNLSSYDASYLELAIRESLPIVTLDKKLKKASMQSNVKIYLE